MHLQMLNLVIWNFQTYCEGMNLMLIHNVSYVFSFYCKKKLGVASSNHAEQVGAIQFPYYTGWPKSRYTVAKSRVLVQK